MPLPYKMMTGKVGRLVGLFVWERGKAQTLKVSKTFRVLFALCLRQTQATGLWVVVTKSERRFPWQGTASLHTHKEGENQHT